MIRKLSFSTTEEAERYLEKAMKDGTHVLGVTGTDDADHDKLTSFMHKHNAKVKKQALEGLHYGPKMTTNTATKLTWKPYDGTDMGPCTIEKVGAKYRYIPSHPSVKPCTHPSLAYLIWKYETVLTTGLIIGSNYELKANVQLDGFREALLMAPHESYSAASFETT